MAHEHEWTDYGTITAWAMRYKEVKVCKSCRTFLLTLPDGTTLEAT